VTNRHADRCHRQDLTELRQLVWIELFHDARTCLQPTRPPAVRVGNRSRADIRVALVPAAGRSAALRPSPPWPERVSAAISEQPQTALDPRSICCQFRRSCHKRRLRKIMWPIVHNHPRRTCMQALLLALLALSIWPTRQADAQSITQDVVIDKGLPVGEPLEKVVDYFTSTTIPSVAIGNGRGGMFLYRSTSGKLAGSWRWTTIASGGAAFEQARAITFPGESHPGIVASIGNRIVWFENPWNGGSAASVTRPWNVHVINPNHGCHDLRLEDLDGDGKIDVICSSAVSLRAPQFVAFQNDPEHWQVVNNVADVGDGVAVVRIGTDTTPHIVGIDRKPPMSESSCPDATGVVFTPSAMGS
jgi:hypothetical protein